MIEPSPMCLWAIRAALFLLLISWGLWAPYAIFERRMPRSLKLIAFVAVTCGVAMTAVMMPWHCEGCKLW